MLFQWESKQLINGLGRVNMEKMYYNERRSSEVIEDVRGLVITGILFSTAVVFLTWSSVSLVLFGAAVSFSLMAIVTLSGEQDRYPTIKLYVHVVRAVVLGMIWTFGATALVLIELFGLVGCLFFMPCWLVLSINLAMRLFRSRIASEVRPGASGAKLASLGGAAGAIAVGHFTGFSQTYVAGLVGILANGIFFAGMHSHLLEARKGIRGRSAGN